jgi:hypothetical protein
VSVTNPAESLDEFIASLSPHEWEWGPIGDNTLGYCNWCKGIARITGDDYSDVFARYRERVVKRWRDEVVAP